MQDEHSTPTLLHKAHGTLHRPDLQIVSYDIKSRCNSEVLEGISSDHRPILTETQTNSQQKEEKDPLELQKS